MTTSAILVPDQGFLTSSVWAGQHVRRGVAQRERIEASMMPVHSFEFDLAGRIVTVEITGEEPNWLYRILNDIRTFASLPVGWDSYDGEPVTFAAAFAALKFLERMLSSDSPTPSVVPTSSGGLQFEWHRSVGDLEVYFSRDGRVSASYVSASGDESWEMEAEKMDSERLHGVVTRL